MKIVILGNPKSDNTLYGHRAFGKRVLRYLTQAGRDYHDLCAKAIPEGTKLLINPLKIDISVYFGDKRKRDIQGHLKAICDGFNKVLYDDDSQIIEMRARKFYDKANPRSEIIIEEIILEHNSQQLTLP